MSQRHDAARSASEVRASVPIELRQGSGGAAPDFFWEILLPRVHFYNRVHFFTAVFNMLKIILYTSYWLPNTNFLILRLNLTDFFLEN